MNALPDLRVERVTAFPDACGKRALVDGFADTTVELVTALPDVKVEFASAFPGVP